MNNRKRVLKICIIAVAVLLLAALLTATFGLVAYLSYEDTGLPRLEVFTKDRAQILSKEEYVDCRVSLKNTDAEFCFEELEAGIRGRGNDTWKYYPKKPYRIKFEEKTSVFGETKNKSWVLLAMYNDFSLAKDRLAFGMADSLSKEGFAPSYHYVDLYLNGDYVGLYLLTDQVDENKGRTGVKEDFDETEIAVPFLVELDARAPEEGKEGVDWFMAGGKAYAIKYPEADERYTQAQFDYIQTYVQTVDALCRKPNVTVAELSQYVDLQSLIDFYLVQELMGQPEINWKSVYMSKTKEGKLQMGPVWDFDWAANGPSTGKHKNEYRNAQEGFRSVDNWFAALYAGSPEFRQAVAARWNEVSTQLRGVIDTVEAEYEMLETAAKRDHLRWHWFRVGSSYKGSLRVLAEWCRERADWFDRMFSSQS